MVNKYEGNICCSDDGKAAAQNTITTQFEYNRGLLIRAKELAARIKEVLDLSCNDESCEKACDPNPQCLFDEARMQEKTLSSLCGILQKTIETLGG